jgi:hypothetical protein
VAWREVSLTSLGLLVGRQRADRARALSHLLERESSCPQTQPSWNTGNVQSQIVSQSSRYDENS